MQHCLAILAIDPDFADAWFLCGVIAARNGAAVKAADIFRKAITLAPAQAEYHAELGKQLIALREPREALDGCHDGVVAGTRRATHTEHPGHCLQSLWRTRTGAGLL